MGKGVRVDGGRVLMESEPTVSRSLIGLVGMTTLMSKDPRDEFK